MMTSIPTQTRANTGVAEQVMRSAAIDWMAQRRGTDVRVIHELVLGERRCDLAFIYADDIVVMEIKGPNDSLSDGRLRHQLREYHFYVPEVWLLVVPKWLNHDDVLYARNVLVTTERGIEIANQRVGKKYEPYRDEMCCSRLLERLWTDEVRSVAARTGLVQQQLVEMHKPEKLRRILARLLTGQEIMREVCSELRSRPLTGIGSDQARAKAGKTPPKNVARGAATR